MIKHTDHMTKEPPCVIPIKAPEKNKNQTKGKVNEKSSTTGSSTAPGVAAK